MNTIDVEAKLITIQPEIGLTEKQSPAEIKIVGELFFLIPLCFLAAWVIAIALFSVFSQKKPTITFNCFPKVPCRDCQFFKDNPYLKCAVHPRIAMTEKAAECTDYRSSTKVS